MAKVKICGISRIEDIGYVNQCLPEYVGFVFAESRRKVSLDMARTLRSGLNSRIKTVGVFVNEQPEAILEIVRGCRLGIVQLHGDESPEYIEDLKASLRLSFKYPVEVWKAIRVRNMDAIKSISNYNADAYLLDTYVENSYGGAGKIFDWNLAAEAGKKNKIILAGGLDIKNVREAVRVVQPYAVDVSSGIETEGFKDGNKVRNFVCVARSYE